MNYRKGASLLLITSLLNFNTNYSSVPKNIEKEKSAMVYEREKKEEPIDLSLPEGVILIPQPYFDNCVSCHGYTGHYDGAYALYDEEGKLREMFRDHMPAPLYCPTIKDKSEEELKDIIKKGRGYMPGFGNLSDIEIKIIIDYIKGLEHSHSD